jgi:hypothetical protein
MNRAQTLSGNLPRERLVPSRESFRAFVLMDLLFLAVLILSTRLATFLHEAVGHAATALLTGGTVQGIRLTLFGGGHAYYDLPDTAGVFARFLVSFSGIAVNLLTGLFALLWVEKGGDRATWKVFPALFGLVSLMGGIAYAAMGFYYQQGDPVDWSFNPTTIPRMLCIPFLAAIPPAAYFVTKQLSSWTEKRFPVQTAWERARLLALTLGLVLTAYGVLYGITNQRSTAVDAPSTAFRQTRETLMEKKRTAVYEQFRKERPDLTEKEIRNLVEQTPITVPPEEVPVPFPLKPVLVFLILAGAVPVVFRKNTIDGQVARLPGAGNLTGFWIAAAGILGLLAATGGWLYRG